MTLSSVIVLANLMSDESRRLCKDSKNMNKETLNGLEYSVILKHSTIEALKEMSRYNNSETYDQIIMRLIRAYNKKGMV